jgi:nucleoid-associated protein YgaU
MRGTMGKVEKVVVLSVLFLITFILVISLSGPSEDPTRLETARPDPASIGGGPAEARTRGGVQAAPRTVSPTGGRRALAPRGTQQSAERVEPGPGRLLHSSIGEEPVASIEGTILVTLEGLLPSYLPEYRFYHWRRGDTWESIASRYYGDAGQVERLHRANEGRSDVASGMKILVPAIDLDAAVDTQSRTPAIPSTSSGQLAVGSSGSYTVVDGDSLWKISKKVYGQGARWQELFEANRDKLASQDDLQTGQVLRIPN